MKNVIKSLFFLGLLLVLSGLFADNEYSISLDSGESFYINDGDDALDISDEWTIETWANIGSYVPGAWECILDRRTVFSFYIVDDITEPLGDYGVKFAVRDAEGIIAASIQTDAHESVTLNFNTWIHLAITYQDSTLRFFVDDTEVYTVSDTSGVWSLTPSTNALNIGGRYWGSFSRQMSDALIDEVRISDIARDLEDIQTDVNDNPYTVDPNTVLLMNLNDASDPPSYQSGTDPLLSGSAGDSNIGSTDYVDPGTLLFGDQSAPIFTDTYPNVQNATGTSMELVVQTNEDGTAYYVVLENDATEPTVEEVQTGTGSQGSAAVSSGNIVLVAGIESIQEITGLVQDTDYDLYIVAEDDEDPTNTQSTVTKIDASTIIDDNTSPVFAENYPIITASTASRLDMAIQINENGIAYFVVLENGATEPTVQEVKNGTGAGGSAALVFGNLPLSAGVEGSVLIENLSVSTDYDIYVIAEDDAVPVNTQETVTMINANTLLNYRSVSSGNWMNAGSWERFNGFDWILAEGFPTVSDNTILIQSTHVITLADTVEADQMSIEVSGQLTITEHGFLKINNGTEVDLSVWGTLRKESDGIISRIDNPFIDFLDNSKFELSGTNKYIIEADWNVNSTCEVSGFVEGSMNSTYHTDQAFGNFVWNCPNQIDDVYLSGALTEINGDFQLIDTNGFELRFTGTAGEDPVVNVLGNFGISGGILNMTSGENNLFLICYNDFSLSGGEMKSTGIGAGNLRLGPMIGTGYSGNFTHSAGVFSPTDVQIRENYTMTLTTNLDLSSTSLTVNGEILFGEFDVIGSMMLTVGDTGQLLLSSNLNLDQSPIMINGILDAGIYSISGDSTFTINSTGILRTGNALGLDGTILMNDVLTLSSAADYEFNGTEAQVTGSLLPTEITDGLFINNNLGVTLSDSTMISGGNTGLILRSGTLFTDTDNLLVFANNGSWDEAGDSSFISGPVAKLSDSVEGFLFPVGKGTLYAPMLIASETTDETIFKAEYFENSYQGFYNTDASLESVSSVEHWILERLSGTANAKVRLYWGEHSFETLPDSLVVAHLNGTTWINEGQSEIDLINKWITSEVISEFSPFTLGSALMEAQPLSTPENIQIQLSESQFTISWDSVSEASSYTIYSSNDPYAETWNLLESGIIESQYTSDANENFKFLRVTANE